MSEKHNKQLSTDKISELDDSQKLTEIMAQIDRLYEAFPDGNIVGHRDYHSAKIKAAQAEERFWNELKLDLAKKGAWGILIVMLVLMGMGISAKFGLKIGG